MLCSRLEVVVVEDPKTSLFSNWCSTSWEDKVKLEELRWPQEVVIKALKKMRTTIVMTKKLKKMLIQMVMWMEKKSLDIRPLIKKMNQFLIKNHQVFNPDRLLHLIMRLKTNFLKKTMMISKVLRKTLTILQLLSRKKKKTTKKRKSDSNYKI